MNEIKYDLAIIGSGPSGMSAAIYGARAGLKVIVIEKMGPGGQMMYTDEIENYPGFTSIKGYELSNQMFAQMQKYDVTYKASEVVDISTDKVVTLVNDEIIKAKTVIIATGMVANKLHVPNEEKLSGRGISFCAICDGNFFKGKNVAVIGGGNAAVEESIYLSNLVEQVYLIHRRDEFRASEIYLNKAKTINNIKFITNANVVSFNGDELLSSITIKENDKPETTLEVAGAFIYIGRTPMTKFASHLNITDESGFILVDQKMATAVAGIYACGDVIKKDHKQVATAINDGAIAALEAYNYIKHN